MCSDNAECLYRVSVPSFCRDIVKLMQRYQLDRRRIEDAYFQYAVLNVCSWYPEYFEIGTLALHNATDSTKLPAYIMGFSWTNIQVSF